MEENGPRIHHLGETVQWPTPPAGEPAEPEVLEQRPTSKRTLATAAGLVLAGVIVGTVAVTAAQGATHDNATTPTAAVGAPQGTLPQGTDPQAQGTVPQGILPQDDGGFAGPPGGGFDGEQRLQGTITAVGTSSVTVQTSSGTATYVVDAATEIRRNGAAAQLSDLRAGDVVLVHVYPNGGATVAERVLAGTGTARTT